MFALLGLIGCSSSDMDQVVIPENDQQDVVIPAGDDLFELTATTLSEEESRAGFTDGNKTQTVWHKGDQVKLTSEAGASALLTNEFEQGDNAFFRGTGTAAAEIDTYYAVYPASEILSNEGVVTLDFAKQDGTEKSAIKAAGWCEGVTKNEIEMSFKPINALLYVTVSNLPAGYTIYEVKFTDLDNKLPSKQTYNIATGAYTNEATDADYYSISTSGTSFFISLPAGYNPATGYVLTVKAKDGAGAEQCTVGAFGANGGFKAGTTSRVTFDWTKNSITSVGPITSYDLYLARNSAANAENSGQIVYCDQYFPTTYNMQNTLISKNFITSVGYTYDGGEFDCGAWWDKTNKQFYFESNLADQAKQAHSVVAWLKTKHNDYIVAYKTLHVTGIPYSVNWRGDKRDDLTDWATTGTVNYHAYLGEEIGYRTMYSYMGTKEFGALFSPTYYTPANVDAIYTARACYCTTGTSLTTKRVDIYSGLTTGTTEPSTKNTKTLSRVNSDYNPGDSQFTDCTNSLTIPAGNGYRIYMRDSHPNDTFYAYNAVIFSNFSIKYNIQ